MATPPNRSGVLMRRVRLVDEKPKRRAPMVSRFGVLAERDVSGETGFILPSRLLPYA